MTKTFDATHRDFWKRPMSTTQVAEALSVSRVTVVRWITEGRLPARRFGRNYQVARPFITLLLEGCQDPETSLSNI